MRLPSFTKNRNNRDTECINSQISSLNYTKRRFTKDAKLFHLNHAIHSTDYLIDNQNKLGNDQIYQSNESVASSTKTKTTDMDTVVANQKKRICREEQDLKSDDHVDKARENLLATHVTTNVSLDSEHSDYISKLYFEAARTPADGDLNLDFDIASESEETLIEVTDEDLKKKHMVKKRKKSSNSSNCITAGLAIALTAVLLMKVLKR